MARSEVNHLYDAATSFRAPNSDVITASGQVGAIDVTRWVIDDKGAYANRIVGDTMRIIVVVEEADLSGDQSYDLALMVGPAGDATTQVQTFSISEIGEYVFSVDTNSMHRMADVIEEMALSLTAGGVSAAGIKIAAWVV